MLKCSYCSNILLPNMDVKYYFDEKFYIKDSKRLLPFCSCDCGTKYYNENGYNKMEVLTNDKRYN